MDSHLGPRHDSHPGHSAWWLLISGPLVLWMSGGFHDFGSLWNIYLLLKSTATCSSLGNSLVVSIYKDCQGIFWLYPWCLVLTPLTAGTAAGHCIDLVCQGLHSGMIKMPPGSINICWADPSIKFQSVNNFTLASFSFPSLKRLKFLHT